MSFFRSIRNAIDAFQNPDPDEEYDDLWSFELPQVIGAFPNTAYKIPKRPSPDELVAQSRKAWIPPGQAVSVSGRTIPGGMVYVGSELDPIAGWETVDPALLDPTLPTAADFPTGGWMSFYLSYSQAQPAERGRFLDWLAAGQGPGAPTTYAFLRIGALERRILFDARHDPIARTELPFLIAEIERLVRAFEDDAHFILRVTDLLTASYLVHGEPRLEQIRPVVSESGWSLPFAILVAIGSFVANRDPITAEWALSWICADPDTQLRTPAIRCRAEFHQLFVQRYRDQHGAGMIVKLPKPRLQVDYHAISATFGHAVTLGAYDLPDVSRVRKPQSQLRELVARVTMELDDYSRYIGRYGDPFSSLALAARPAALGDIAHFPSIAPLSKLLRQAIGDNAIELISTTELLACVPGLSQPPTQKQASSVGELVRRLGYGLEPDPEFDRRSFLASKRVALYRGDPADASPAASAIQRAALAFCALLVRVDGTLDTRTQTELIDVVATTWPISIDDTFRLGAYAAWLADHPIALTDAKRLWNQTNGDDSEAMAKILVHVATRNGAVSVAKMQLLTRIYRILGRSEPDLHTDLHHRFATGAALAPTSSSRQDPSSRNGAASDNTVALDVNLLRRVQKETTDIQNVLGTVFVEDKDMKQSSTLPGDPIGQDPYAQLIAALAERPSCTIDELHDLARSFGLMAAGAIETINERADSLGLEPLLECDDKTCDVHEPTLNGMLTRA